MKRIPLILVWLIWLDCGDGLAQEQLRLAPSSLEKAERSLVRRTRNLKCIDRQSPYHLWFVYFLTSDSISAASLADGSIVPQLRFATFKSNQRFPNHYGYLYDDSLRIAAFSDGRTSACLYATLGHEQLLRYFLSEKLDLLFQLDRTSVDIYFGIKDGKLRTLKLGRESVEAIPPDQITARAKEILGPFSR